MPLLPFPRPPPSKKKRKNIGELQLNYSLVSIADDMLYWTDSGFMNIERCYLSAGVDGCETTRNIIMDATNLPFAPYNILVDGDFLYYNYDSMSTT